MIEALQVPAKINFDSTFKCNANCSFCDIPERHARPDQLLDFEKAKGVIVKAAEEGVMRINFFGGEPLLVKRIPDLVKLAHDLGLHTSLITNGTLLTKKICREISNFIDSVGISVHGAELTHNRILGIPNAYAKIINGTKCLEGYRIRYGINYTIMETNHDDFEDTVRYFITHRKAQFVALNRYIESTKKTSSALSAPSVQTLNTTLDVVRNLHADHPHVSFSYAIYFPLCLVSNPDNLKYVNACGVGMSFCSVDFNGDIRFCSYSNKVLGNIFESGLCTTWQSSRDLIEYREGGWLPSKCKTCDLLAKCASGCKASNPTSVYSADVMKY